VLDLLGIIVLLHPGYTSIGLAAVVGGGVDAQAESATAVKLMTMVTRRRPATGLNS
jgi:hypothetical protein